MPISTYRRNIRAAIRGLWSGAISGDQFSEALRADIDRNLTKAWDEGAKECGVLPNEYTDAEHLALAEGILKEQSFIGQLRDAVEASSKENGGKLTPLFGRAELWVNRYPDFVNRAKAMACGDQKAVWVVNPAKESCKSCLKLNGKVKRLSFWNSSGILPRVANADYLECHGFQCGCDLIITDAPISKGPLPRLP